MWKLLLLLCTLVSTASAASAVRTWTGLGADNNWTTAGNWDVLPVAGDELTFNGGTRLTNTNDFAATTSFKRIVSSGATGNVTLNGSNSMTLTDYIYNSSAKSLTINFPIILNVATATILSDVGAAPVTITGVISETGGARKLAVNAVTGSTNIISLRGVNTYTGTTTLTQGWLSIDTGGSTHASSAVTVTTGSFNNRLLGDGTINGSLTLQNGATIFPGNNGSTSYATLTTGALTMDSGSIYRFNYNGSSLAHSRITSTGAVSISGDLTFANETNPGSITGSSSMIILSGTSITGTFASYPNNSTFTTAGGARFRITYTSTTVTLNGASNTSAGMMALFP